MTEEQRYRESIQIEKDKVQLLKRIAIAMETIAVHFSKLSDEDVERLVEAVNKARMMNFGIDLCSCEDTIDRNPDNK